MAHFAELDENNVVTRVIVVSNRELINPHNNVEEEVLGIAFCKKLYGGNWIQASYNKTIRKHYPGKGWSYDSVRDVFVPPKPYDSWVLNESTILWEPPITQPELTEEQVGIDAFYEWDEDAYQTDNTTGWVLNTSRR